VIENTLHCSDHWRKNIPDLAKSHRVYSIDLIGYGYSDKPNPRQIGDDSFYTFDTWAAQLNEFCLDVVKDEAFFICNSIGGKFFSSALIFNYWQGYFKLFDSHSLLQAKRYIILILFLCRSCRSSGSNNRTTNLQGNSPS